MPVRKHPKQPLVEHVVRHRAGGWWLERPFPVPGEERIHLVVVLLRLERTGAVDEESTRVHAFGGRAEQLRLCRGQQRQVGVTQAPARVGVPPERAGAGAGDVEQDRVESR